MHTHTHMSPKYWHIYFYRPIYSKHIVHIDKFTYNIYIHSEDYDPKKLVCFGVAFKKKHKFRCMFFVSMLEPQVSHHHPLSWRCSFGPQPNLSCPNDVCFTPGDLRRSENAYTNIKQYLELGPFAQRIHENIYLQKQVYANSSKQIEVKASLALLSLKFFLPGVFATGLGSTVSICARQKWRIPIPLVSVYQN